MADDKKYDDIDLDSILLEINSTISKEVSKTNSVKTKKAKTKDDEGVAKRPAPKKKPVTPKPKINSAFADSAKIIEHAVEDSDDDLYEGHAVRFIAVTASEVVDETPVVKTPVVNTQAANNQTVNDIISQLPNNSVEKPQTVDIDITEEEPAIISLGNISAIAPTVPISVIEPAKEDDITREHNHHIKKLRKNKLHPRMTRRQKFTALIGFIMTVLVIIGSIAVISNVSKLTYDAVGQTALKKELAHQIFPFAIIDVPQFDDVKKLDNMSIISASIWAFIIDENDKSKYKQDDLGSIYVPDVDIELYIRRLFGNEITIKHQSVENVSVMMYYDEAARTYMIESTPKLLPYRPRIDKITKKDDIYTLKVSYILPDAMWNFDIEDTSGTVDKTMEYVLKKNKETYQVISVKLLSITGYTSPNSNNQPAFDPIIDDLTMSQDISSSEDSDMVGLNSGSVSAALTSSADTSSGNTSSADTSSDNKSSTTTSE